MILEEEETDNVGKETGATDGNDELRLRDLGVVDEAGDGLHADGEAEGEEENTVD